MGSVHLQMADDTDFAAHLDVQLLEGRHIRLERVTSAMRSDLQSVLDCDPESWRLIKRASGAGAGFDGYWRTLEETSRRGARIAFAIRAKSSGQLVGTSSFVEPHTGDRRVEIGATFIHPTARSGPANPEAKLLMLGHAFDHGAIRVEFQTDERNARSRAALVKLGARVEGTLRNHAITWTGHRRNSVILSIIDEEWPSVREGLIRRLEGAG